MKQDLVNIQRSVKAADTGEAEIHLLLHVTNPILSFREQLETLTAVLGREVTELQAQVVFLRVFLSDAANQTPEVMGRLLDDGGYPISILQQAPANRTKVAFWVYLKTGTEVRALSSGLYEAKGKSGCQLWTAGLTASASDSKGQTTLILEDYVMMLLHEGLTLKDNCLRTWLFVHDIDNQYAGMVQARNDVFRVQGLTKDTHYIASTGINGRTAEPHASVCFDAVAFRNVKPGDIHYLYAAHNMNRTSDYGVSFERGTAIDLADRRQVYISGTASIDNRGQMLHAGDVISQARRMMQNISMLLQEASCTTDDIQMALVYLRDAADYPRVERFFSEYYPSLPHLIVHAPVCRPAWLIETECMAMKVK